MTLSAKFAASFLMGVLLSCSSIQSDDGAIDSGVVDAVSDSVDDLLFKEISSRIPRCVVVPEICCPTPSEWPRLKTFVCMSRNGIEYTLIRDEILDLYCEWNEASDGLTRCLPGLYMYHRLYLNSTCSTEFGVTHTNDSRFVSVMLHGTQFVYESLGPKTSGDMYTVVFQGSTPICVWTPLPILSDPHLTFHLVGNEVDPSSFVAK